ncbi:hypothetical protein AURDEDRAFT_181765 [Auricularia subglabra TFB-10046 SS5]|nr:hypothetical protein AURDEDRAFT_181765 [Auricularia subglabra TFB-10046 SS5]
MAEASQRPRMESLLSSFPAPPSFIPPSPSPMMLAYDRSSRASSELEFNPPPTRPPTMPLPPLPAGGGVSELGLDALMLLCNTPSRRTSVASKRMSRMSDTNVVLPGARPSHMAPMQPPSSVSLPDDHPAEPAAPAHRRPSVLPPPVPSPPPCETPVPRRPASPDIQHILATTPRPLVRRMLPHNLGARRASTGASSSPSLIHSTASSQSSSDNDDDILAPGEQSDSSIDTRTPLPHLMVKAGVLSPYSKILITPAEDSAPRPAPGSSKNSLILKDGRDTQRRKNRHRDGRLLREGVGLTTGLGWSDSEDEDAPIPHSLPLPTYLDILQRRLYLQSLPLAHVVWRLIR